MTAYEPSQAHGLRLMSGRDPDKQHRVATALELLICGARPHDQAKPITQNI